TNSLRRFDHLMRNTMTIAFRTDCGTRIGTGHVRRCLTLAEELRRRGARVVFISREQPGDLISLTARSGFETLRLPFIGGASERDEGHAAWLGVPQAVDAESTIAALNGLKPDWLVVDHYAINAEWEKALRPAVNRILVIDDLADRDHDCDALLDQNYFGADTASRYDHHLPETCIRLLGPVFALLQPHYAVIRSALPPRDGYIRRILIFFGGSDQTNETAKVLTALSHPSLMHLAVDVVLGSNHPNPEGVRTLVAARANTILHGELRSLAGLMARADLAVGAAGATTWERLSVGLPSIIVTIAS